LGDFRRTKKNLIFIYIYIYIYVFMYILCFPGEERTLLRLLEGALDVSEYTDHVDVVRGFSWRSSKTETMQEQIYELFRMLSGLLIAGSYKVRYCATHVTW
jgi:hypothetical protein